MPLFLVILILLVVGFILWLIETQTLIPLDPTIKKIIQIVWSLRCYCGLPMCSTFGNTSMQSRWDDEPPR